MDKKLKDKLIGLINSKNIELCLTNEFTNGASLDEIEICEKNLSRHLPKDYVEFLKFSNGCKLFNMDNIDGFNFLGTHDIYNINQAHREIYEDDWEENIIIFCEIIGEGNYLGFRIISEIKYEIVDCFHELSPSEWANLPDIFFAFMNKLINLKGEKYWLTPTN